MSSHSVALNNTDEFAPFNEKVSKGRMLILGFQHVLTMMPVSVSVPLILGSALELDTRTTSYLVSATLFTTGITVLLQTFGLGRLFGSRLPLMFGASFAPLGIMILLGKQYGLPMVFGAVIGSAVLMAVISCFLHKLLRFMPPVVSGSFVTFIGISLAPAAFTDLAGGAGHADFGSPRNFALGLVVMAIILLISRYGRGIVKSISLLIGLLIGSLISWPMGLIDFTPLQQVPVIEIITPFHFGAPQFALAPILMMTVFCFVNLLQCLGGVSVLDDINGLETSHRLQIRMIRAQVLGQAIAGCFNSGASTVFKENIGLFKLSGLQSRSLLLMAAVMMMLLSIFPQISTAFTLIPKPVLGGAMVILFGIILAAGISILSKVVHKASNFTIIGTSLSAGIGAEFAKGAFQQFPELLSMLLSNGLFVVSFTAIVLNIVLNRESTLLVKKSITQEQPA
ncbi:uracil-xanthine permease family protein [Aeromonas sp. MdU4]|uniref:uracil-xanthine permease family protein n=1 Tax=Aeromonas sp. MdU4 TaxID=3342819 RepID=UPI0035B81B17